MKVAVALAFLFSLPLFAQDWPQWANDPSHAERARAVGQSLQRNAVDIVYDPLALREIFAYNDELLVHYQAPLVDGDDVYMLTKSGTFDASTFATQIWNESKFTWQNGTLAKVWDLTTDWKPPGSISDFFEPVFHPALANGFLYVPAAGGSLLKVNKTTGTATRINPFASVNASTYVISPLTVDASGDILYNVVQVVPTVDFYDRDVVDSWLVRVSPSDAVEKISYSTITAGTPRPTDACLNQFTIEPLPWPPSPTAVPASIPCGSQRPGMNISPAIAADGTIYVVTRAHFNSRWAYLVAVTPDLHQKWIATLRDRFNDGCGVPPSQGGSLPPNGANGGCRTGAPLGVDPATNGPGGGRANDNSSATPVVAPDGSIYYGAYTRYNYEQGHLMHFAADGTYLGAYRFGWDITPAIYIHDGTYSVVTKDNHYGNAGSYCGDPVLCGVDRNATNPDYPEGYFVTQLSRNMNVEWSFRATNTESCSRQSNGTIACNADHPSGFEWCVNAFVIDAAGVLYANSEDGWLYAIAQGGALKSRIFQRLSLGAAYTPTSMDAAGRVYSQNAGHLFVVTGGRTRSVRHP
jgi:hypothetical protein